MNRMILAMAAAVVMTMGGAVAANAEIANGNAAEAAVMNVEGTKKVSRQIVVPYFSNIKIVGSTDVVFKQTNGGKPKLTVVGYKEDVDRMKISSDGKTLTVAEQPNRGGWSFFSGGDGVTVYVYAPDLTGVSITGSGDFDAEGKIDTDKLSVNVKGSGDVEMKNVICDDAHIDVYGSGDVEIKNLVAQRSAEINVKGSGDVEIGFTRTGNVSCLLNGSGDVKLKGDVKSLRKKQNGSGDIDTSKLKRW